MNSEEERDGALRHEYYNDVEVCRAFLLMAGEPKNLENLQSERILSRTDLDWNRLITYLTECGLARPLRAALKSLEFVEWVPQSIIERLQPRARQDAVNDVVKRQALGRIAEALSEIGGRGVLLKGTALQSPSRS